MTTLLFRDGASRRPDGDTCGQLKACQPSPEQATINIAFDVRRDEHGSIDIAFYKVRAQRLRHEEVTRFARSLRSRCTACLLDLRRWISERR
jgi:hypothetical protein